MRKDGTEVGIIKGKRVLENADTNKQNLGLPVPIAQIIRQRPRGQEVKALNQGVAGL